MKKLLRYMFFSLVTVILFTGCEKWMDINYDPNTISDSPSITEKTYLIGVEAEWAASAIQMFPWWGGMSDMLLWYAWDGTTSQTFSIGPGYGNGVWNMYSGSLNHATALYDKAKANGNKRFQGIGALISAWHWYLIADMYDKAPLSQAMKGNQYLHPETENQDAIYTAADALLDEAISLFNDPAPGPLVPTIKEDYMMGANFAKWTKLAYSLKARYAMRLIYATGKTKTGQADIVLAALATGMASSADNCVWSHKNELANRSWFHADYEYDYSGQGQTPTVWLVDTMNALNDPRRAVFFTFAEDIPTGYKGLKSGSITVPGSKPSRYKSSFVTMSYPDHIMVYSECLFLKAEAYALKAQWANAKTALDAAVTEDMTNHGVAPADIATYLAQPALAVPANEEGAQGVIITQKYLANIYETMESYFDFIRTGYPKFGFKNSINNVINFNTFPRRYPYPQEEIDRNPNIKALGQPDWMTRGSGWDKKTFPWRTK